MAIRKTRPADTTIRLYFEPAEAAQVDFGAGPMLADAQGVMRRTWAFVMTLAFSRHQYVEFVWDQTVETWLGCHRRAFEWFGAVPARLIYDFVPGNKIVVLWRRQLCAELPGEARRHWPFC